MNRGKTTAEEAVLEQLIKHGPGEITALFAKPIEY